MSPEIGKRVHWLRDGWAGASVVAAVIIGVSQHRARIRVAVPVARGLASMSWVLRERSVSFHHLRDCSTLPVEQWCVAAEARELLLGEAVSP